MIHTVIKQVDEEIIESKECDCCHRKVLANKIDDMSEFQEFCHIRLVGGYGSIFGDEARIEVDLCQHCLKKLLGDYIRIDLDWIEELEEGEVIEQ